MKKQDQITACRRKTSIGGQALMEGIMMRGPAKTAMAVRNTKGEVVVEEFPTTTTKRPAICRWPIIRGVFGYIDSMVLGYKCLMRSAELSGLEDVVEESPKKKKKRLEAEKKAQESLDTAPAEEAVTPEAAQTPEQAEKKDEKSDKIPSGVMNATMILSVVLGLALGLALFLWLPATLYQDVFVHFCTPYRDFLKVLEADAVWFWVPSLLKSLVEGIVRILLMIGYMAGISLMKDIRRTYMYHGAEHKSIFCYEAGMELTVENVRAQRRFHPRCGTSFLILMLLVSIVVTFFIDPAIDLLHEIPLPFLETILKALGEIPFGDTLLRVLIKIPLIPLIVGIGYELIKLAGRHDNWFTKLISLPGVWLQHLTVLEPTDDMIECAITALNRVIPQDDSDRW